MTLGLFLFFVCGDCFLSTQISRILADFFCGGDCGDCFFLARRFRRFSQIFFGGGGVWGLFFLARRFRRFSQIYLWWGGVWIFGFGDCGFGDCGFGGLWSVVKNKRRCFWQRLLNVCYDLGGYLILRPERS